MYMRPNLADLRCRGLSHADALHGYITASRQAYRVEMPGISPFRCRNSGLIDYLILCQETSRLKLLPSKLENLTGCRGRRVVLRERRGVSSPCVEDTPEPDAVIARIESEPTPAEIDLHPSCKIHRRVRRRDTDIA